MMIKKIAAFLSAAALTVAASGVLYADADGALFSDCDSAKILVDKYMTNVMRAYSGDDDVSFRNIVREGCDFWYYNNDNKEMICRAIQSEGSAEIAEYSVEYDSVKYSDRKYTVETQVTQKIKYKNSPETVSVTCPHTFIIEKCGHYLYITNDISDGSDKLIVPTRVLTPDEPSI